VVFTNPLLVSAELWHFLGYEGVFVAYAWPSTPKRLAYASDLETTALSAHFLQSLLEFLSENTDAENIHIVGYSAGTRVVVTALFQLALLNNHKDKADIQKKLRIGNVILVGSDLDRQLFGAYLLKGLLDVPKRLTVYASEADKALSLSRRIFRRGRLGQILKGDELNSRVIEYLKKKEELVFINVTEAKEALSGNGHSYFRRSPWVSSDILMTLMYDLKPENRGLVKLPDLPIWTFPKNYSERLVKGLKEAKPDLFK
jgi:esterase/lipase superfamily enzyme